jgi:hypothetical protein
VAHRLYRWRSGRTVGAALTPLGQDGIIGRTASDRRRASEDLPQLGPPTVKGNLPSRSLHTGLILSAASLGDGGTSRRAWYDQEGQL